MKVPARLVTKDFSQFNPVDIQRGRVRLEVEIVFGTEPLPAGTLCLVDLGVIDTETLPLSVNPPTPEPEPEPVDPEAPFGRKADGTPRKRPYNNQFNRPKSHAATQ